MTTTSNFKIGPIDHGLTKNIKPWALPETAWEKLINMYQWRGRLIRRPGYKLLGQLANGTPVMGLRTQEGFAVDSQTLIAFDTTQAYSYNGTSFSALPSTVPVTWSGSNSQFFYTTNYAGAFWATNSKPGFNGFIIDTTTGFTSPPGPLTLATAVNVQTAPGSTLAVNDFVYFVNVKGAAALNNLIFGQVIGVVSPGLVYTVQVISFPPGITTFVTGAVSSGAVMVSTQALVGQDGIKYYGNLAFSGSSSSNSWANYNPPVDPFTVLCGALLIFPYRGYLVFLNTYEGNEKPGSIVNYGNRARWTQIGTPYYSSPQPSTPSLQAIDPNTARDDLFGKGGANDAPTSEVIVTAAFIRDILVVFFERSTWRLRFVNNAQNPFVWERVNIDFGAQCTFSAIPFDKGLMAIGNRGIVISDGNDTIRFDEEIPDDVFQIRQANNGFQRVNGIRTFQSKLCYWTFPSLENPDGTFPDLVLVYNYETKKWAYFDDCFTCFGYYYPISETAPTWGDLTDLWPSYFDQSADDNVTGLGVQTTIAGNQQGFVFQLEQTSAQNDPSLSISNIAAGVVTSANNNLPDGSWIQLSSISGVKSADGVSLNGRNFKIANPTNDPNTFKIQEFQPINAGNAVGLRFPTVGSFSVDFVPIIPGSVQINVGTLQFKDNFVDGTLQGSDGTSTGTINYTTGALVLNFSAPIGSTPVYVRVVSPSSQQSLVVVNTTGVYVPGGLISKISNISVRSKIFNFFNNDRRSRLSKIDFYVNNTVNGQFTCNVLGDSSEQIINIPFPDNIQSNVVLTSQNPYQVAPGAETIYRLFCDAIAQTIQLEFKLSDAQMAVSSVNASDIEILALMVSMRQGGRLV